MIHGIPAEFFGQRGVSYDILCEFADGRFADIEMQAFDQKYDYAKRAEYQVARLETTYLKKGESWDKAPIVYQITVLDFPFDANSKDVVSRYAMRTKDGRELSNSLNVIFIELSKVACLEKTLETNSLLENWAIFLKNADNPQKSEIINKLADKEAGLMKAQKSLSSISANQDLWIAQYRQEIFERDRISSLAAMRREGLEAGRAEGIKAGRAEGREKAKKETAKSLLAMNILTIEQIAQATGLSTSDIEKLQTENK